MSPHPLHRLVRLGLVAVAFAASGAPPVTAQVPDDAMELLVDVRIEDGPTGLMLARDVDGAVLLAAQQVLSLAEVHVTKSLPDSLLEFVIEPSATVIRIRTDSLLVLRGHDATPIPARRAYWEGELLFVDAGLLADLLGGRVTVNISELSIVLRQPDLPVVRRLARERRATRLRHASAPDPEPTSLPTGLTAVGGAVLDWNVNLYTSALPDSGLRVDNGVAQFALGIDLLGGSGVVLHDRSWYGGGAGTAHATYASWSRAWPTNPWIRQLRVGDALGTGPRARFARGVAITNAPFVRSSDFAVASLSGLLAPGWDLELYRSGVLVDAGRADPTGHYAFRVPIRYGSNPVELIAYGPHGEVQRYQQTFEVPFERLAAGLVEYGISAAQCRTGLCDGTGNADLRWGASRQLTLRAGADYFWSDTLASRWYPYASAVFQATRSFALSADVIVNAEYGGRLSVAPTPDFQLTAGHRHLIADSLDVVAGLGTRGDQTDAFLFYRPGFLRERVFFRLGGIRFATDTRTTHQGQATMSVQLRIGRVDIGTILARDASVQSAGDSGAVRTSTLFRAGAVLTPGSVVRALRQTVLRTAIDWATTDGLDLASATLSRRFMDYFYVEGGGGWDRDRGGFFELAFRADLNVGRFSTSNFVDREGSGGLQRAEGSVLFGRRGRPLSFANGRSVGRAGLAGVVFLDLDGDGEFDPGEPPVPGARLRIGPWYVHADEQGKYATWDVVPFEALTIWVDPASGTDAQWTPAATRYVVRPDPNRFRPVNIPFVQTAEVMGEVRLLPANTAMSGIEVQIIPEDGSDPYTARTFSDGVFYVMGVRPGQYRVTVSPQTQDAYGVVSEDAAFTVEAGKTSVVEGIVLTLWKVDGSDR